MMDTQEFDRKVLAAICRTVELDPDSELCPDLDAIAAQDKSLPEKAKQLRSEIVENFRARQRGDL